MRKNFKRLVKLQLFKENYYKQKIFSSEGVYVGETIDNAKQGFGTKT